ncbi:MAG: hypothetical protein M3Q31_03815 [Actinomycetota bacterium]|nr:hypothetical protein [Actinomycetota bacterium]
MSAAATAMDRTVEWWIRLAQAVDDLACRYPRTYGTTIPASWRDDLETVELLDAITSWRRELDERDVAAASGAEAIDLDDLRLPVSALERARQEWEWHAHRDSWLVRLAETGRAPIGAASDAAGVSR